MAAWRRGLEVSVTTTRKPTSGEPDQVIHSRPGVGAKLCRMTLPPEEWTRSNAPEREVALTGGPQGEGASTLLLGALGTALTVARDPAAIARMQRLVGDYVSFLSRMLEALDPSEPQSPFTRKGPPFAAAGAAVLSERELAIVRLLAGGHAVGSIARLLDLSAYTVRNHLKACYRKLGLHSQIEVVNYAFAHGLVSHL